MTVYPFKVTDNQGNAIEGAKVQISSSIGILPAGQSTAYTDYSGNASVDDGAYWFTQCNYTVSALGFQTQTGTAHGIGVATTITVSLPRLIEPNSSGGCPSGYMMQNGQCVQMSATNFLSGLLSAIKSNWLIILVLVFAFAMILLMFYRPKTVTSLARSVKA